MGELPEKYPEYSIMYKTLSNQIKVLKKRKENSLENEVIEIDQKIKNYQLEMSKIKKMFPENFFEGI
ncbi:MAG: hypothetical protein HKP26_03940 [Nitrosopumilus sp.]|nr:hypothetical protein [Nitrosopumilus sp.]NNM02701.1 hypothetical protein [Nitrosopumilus sp.]